MKINYWHYWFEKCERTSSGKIIQNPSRRYHFNFPALLDNYSAFDNIEFKRRIKRNKDFLVLSISYRKGTNINLRAFTVPNLLMTF